MINGNKVLALITARGGSKRVEKKNIRPFGDKPLIAWSIEAAQNSQYVDRTILSCEDDEIIQVAKEYGCDVPFIRPAELASDTASHIDVTTHALDEMESEGYTWLVVLQPTSPLRLASDIDGALEACEKAGANSALGLTEPDQSPIVMFSLNEEGYINPAIDHGLDLQVARSQDFPPYYAINGALYVVKISWYRENLALFGDDSLGYIMPQERSINIDTERDFKMGELMLEVCLEEGLL